MQTQQTNTSAHGQALVSFIIPIYNVPTQLLTECLDSILSLPLSADEREVILVDDGSDVSPIQALGDYLNYIVYLRQKNSGLSSARNQGLQMATGRYVQFVDGDDKLLPSTYTHVLDKARQGETDFVMFCLTEQPMPKSSYTDLGPMSGAELMRNHNIHGSACGYLFLRQLLGTLRFRDGIYHEDEEFTPQLLLKAENAWLSTAQAYMYRQRPHSITTTADAPHVMKRLDDTKGILMRLYALADRLPTDDKTALQRRVAQLTMDYLYHVITDTRNRQYLDAQLSELRQAGLFPLPRKHYTRKYTWFRRLMQSDTGISLLMRVLPHAHRER